MRFFSTSALKKYIFFILVSFLATFVLLALLSIAFSFFPPSHGIFNFIGNYSFVLPVVISSFLVGKSYKRKGLLSGIFSAVFCVFIIILCGKMFFETSEIHKILTSHLPIAVICGALSGIIGVNSK